MNRRCFLKSLTAGALTTAAPALLRATSQPPNIVFILADDLGYEDLSCYGSRIATPNLDQFAREGVIFRQFNMVSSVCSPSRAGILTGRYPVRTGVPGVFSPTDNNGMNVCETTIAQMLKPAGYKTSCIGKWHLGSLPKYLPTNRGFDEYFGMPYSNDQDPTQLLNNTDVIESPVSQVTLTQRYTDRAVSFIQNSKDSPFFLYMAHWAPHLPLTASKPFRGKSHRGLYGDAVQEMDWSVGQVMQSLKDTAVDNNTLVIFTSDNGPWFQGSAGDLRGRKGEAWEGGVRESFLARFPGTIPAGLDTSSFGSALDLLPTIAAFAGVTPPANVDGVDISPILTGAAKDVDHPVFLYFDAWNLQCARMGLWKLHLARYNCPPWIPAPAEGRFNLRLMTPELYNVYDDPGETTDCSGDNPDVVAWIQGSVAQALPSFPPEVQNAWNDTQRRPVYPNTAGAFPAMP